MSQTCCIAVDYWRRSGQLPARWRSVRVRVAAQVAATTFRPVVHEQDQWLDKLTGKHRVVVDVTSAVGVTDMLRFVGNIYEGNRTGMASSSPISRRL